MVLISELKENKRDCMEAIAELHKKAFPSFFLTQLGVPFLRTLYTGYMEDRESGIILAENDGKPIGFIAYSKNYPRFYKVLIKNHLFKFAICSLGAAIRHPSYVKRILGAFKKSERVKKKEKYVELASICVDPKIKGKGVGTALIHYLKVLVDFDIYAYICLETDAEENDAVNNFYVKNGFRLATTYTTAENRKMNEYHYRDEGR